MSAAGRNYIMRTGSSAPAAGELLSVKSAGQKWTPHMGNTTMKHAHFSAVTVGLAAVSAIPSFRERSTEYKDIDMVCPQMRAGRAMRS